MAVVQVDLDATRVGSRLPTDVPLVGDFGMTPEHREVSLACAERVLLPEVRNADEDNLILADGFTCRTQIGEVGPARRPRHLAEVLAAAVDVRAPHQLPRQQSRKEERDAAAAVERQP